MGIIKNMNYVANQNTARNTKESQRLQQSAATQAATFERQLLEQMAFQSQALADIRDLLKAQQT